MTKQVAKQADAQLPSYMKQDAGRGSENVGTDDIQMPRIDVLQDLSPHIKKTKPEYIEGAESGMLFNTLTGELYTDGVLIIPVYWRKQFLIWKDQDKGGGLRGIYDNELEAKQFIATQDDAGDLEAVETAENVVMIIDGDSITEAVFSLAKSKMKVNRKFNSLIRLNGGDRFSRVYQLRSVPDQNAGGQDYWNVAVDYAKPESGEGVLFPTEEQYKHAEHLYEQITSGQREVKTNHQTETEGASDIEDVADGKM